MAGYTLDFPSQMQASQFPDWMPQRAPTQQLKGSRRKLGELFDFDPIAQTGNQFLQSQMGQQMATTGAAARAAQNRAMLSGGRVGASFAQASAMLPMYAQQNEQAFKLAGLQGQMNAQRAGLDAQLAQGIAGARGQHTGMMSQYAMGQQRLAQDESQFGRDFDLRSRMADADLEMSAERLRMLRQQNQRDEAVFDRAMNPQRRNWAQFSPSWGGGINPTSLWNS